MMTERLYRYPSGPTSSETHYVVCDRLLDAETNEHCEFDGRVPVDADGFWRCPACHYIRHEPDPAVGVQTEEKTE